MSRAGGGLALHGRGRPRAWRARSPWPRGRVIGGSSSINAMASLRGLTRDFDDWAQAGATGWHWETVRETFQAMETRLPPGGGALAPVRGNGPVLVSDLTDRMHPLPAISSPPPGRWAGPCRVASIPVTARVSRPARRRAGWPALVFGGCAPGPGAQAAQPAVVLECPRAEDRDGPAARDRCALRNRGPVLRCPCARRGGAVCRRREVAAAPAAVGDRSRRFAHSPRVQPAPCAGRGRPGGAGSPWGLAYVAGDGTDPEQSSGAQAGTARGWSAPPVVAKRPAQRAGQPARRLRPVQCRGGPSRSVDLLQPDVLSRPVLSRPRVRGHARGRAGGVPALRPVLPSDQSGRGPPRLGRSRQSADDPTQFVLHGSRPRHGGPGGAGSARAGANPGARGGDRGPARARSGGLE
ncbi:MAG TPA: hypothetical protein DIU07_10800 [Rhodobacteraceae bacterium]|nr:hypothetical protein [Paracoccaceae bacterium]